jgi:hypothetical protein
MSLGQRAAAHATTFEDIGERVLVTGAAGLPVAEAEIVANNWHRPHLVQVSFLRSQAPEWIFRSRIAGPARAGTAFLPGG